MYSTKATPTRPMDLTGWSILVGALVLFPLLHSSGAAAMTRALFVILRFAVDALLVLGLGA